MGNEAPGAGKMQEGAVATSYIEQQTTAGSALPSATLQKAYMAFGHPFPIAFLKMSHQPCGQAPSVGSVAPPVLLRIKSSDVRLYGDRVLKNGTAGKAAVEVKTALHFMEEPVLAHGIKN